MTTRKRSTSRRASAAPTFTVPGMAKKDAAALIDLLQRRLVSLTDLALTLKHVHWNVIGPNFIAVHTMLDPQVDAIHPMVDEIAERMATLGGEPNGLPGGIVATRTWDDYDVGRAPALEHLGALDVVYQGVIEDHRKAVDDVESLDLVTQDVLIGHLEKLELFHWFVRGHLESMDGGLITGGATTERGAQRKVRAARKQA